MNYNWDGMRKLSFEEVKKLHDLDKLCGCMYLYDDNTECYIDEMYTWEEIKNHYDNGGEVGIEIKNLVRVREA